jgi:alcohol dehydrogenase class IV
VTWEFATAGRVVFGAGARHELASSLRAFGSHALLVVGRHLGGGDSLPDLGATTRFVVAGEPTTETARAGVAAYRDARCDFVIGIGGGSVLDAAKAVAALATNIGDPLDYLEVIGRGRKLEAAPAPCVAVPTTAGTGSEVTRNAVLGSREHARKASLRHPAMLPRLAIVDPELTMTLPREATASTGLDALTQLIEPYVSVRATPLTDALCLDGMRRVARSLRVAASPQGATDMEARSDMALASLFGGLALANAGLGVVHGLAAPIGGMFPAPHGAVCAVLLAHGMSANLRALQSRTMGHPAIDRYRHIAVALTGDPAASAEAGVAAVTSLCSDLAIPGLRAFGVSEAHLPEICREAQRASSMKSNPVELDDQELREVLVPAL